MVNRFVLLIIICFLLSMQLAAESKSWLKTIAGNKQVLKSGLTLRVGESVCVTESSFSFNVENNEREIEVGEDSLFWIRDDLKGLGPRIELFKGQMKVSSDKLVAIDTIGVSSHLLKGQVYVWSEDSSVALYVKEGAVDIISNDVAMRLRKNQSVLLHNGVIISHGITKGLSEEIFLNSQSRKKTLFHSKPMFLAYKEWNWVDTSPFDSAQEAVLRHLSVLNKHQWLLMLENGRQQLFAQELMTIEGKLPILPSSMSKHFKDKQSLKDLARDLKELEVPLKIMAQEDQNFVSFFVRQVMAEKLISKSRWKDAWSGRFKSTLKHHSNVTEVADNSQTNVSQLSGEEWAQRLKLTYSGRRSKWGKPSIEFLLNDRSYYDDTFEAREYSSFGLKAKLVREFGRKKSKLAQINPSFSMSGDFLSSSGSRDHAFQTYNLGAELVFRPLKGKGNYSDLFMSFLNIGIDWRDYLSGFDIDSDLDNKDILTPSVSWIGVNFDKYKAWTVRETAVLGLRLPQSDSSELEYFSINFDLSVAFSKGAWEFKPLYAHRFRDQSDYFKSSREDHKNELGFFITKKVYVLNCDLIGGFKWMDQESSVSSLEFEDRVWSLSFGKSF